MSKEKSVYLCHAKRTALGSFGGVFASVSAIELGAHVIKAVLREAKLSPEKIDEVILGCVLQAGLGQAPARQAAIKAGLPVSVQAMTINKVCSSGLKAVMLGANAIRVGDVQAVIAGGMENMSMAPYLLPKLRSGARLGHTEAYDSMIYDGLWDPYKNYHMGSAAELCARENKFSREAQDAFAIESYTRANKSIKEGCFVEEIAPIQVKQGKAEVECKVDEEPGKFQPDKIPTLKPAFEKDGTVTPANASSINDGAAAMLLCTEEFATKHSITPLAKIIASGWAGQAPEWFTTAPVGAIEGLLKKTGKKASEVDLFEINEAFSVVALACSSKLDIPMEKLNICGGAVALGHPIGASGARILTTLCYSLKRTGKKLGVAAICNGGGEATAMMVERV